MKNVSTFIIVLLLFAGLGQSTIASEIADSSLNVTYIGATGYLIESSTKKVLIEPTYGDVVKSFGYPFANDQIENDVVNGANVFGSIDLIFISHFHEGHFEVHNTIQCIKSNPQAVLITSDDALKMLKDSAENFTEIENRVFVPQIGLSDRLDTVINNIEVSLTKTEHLQPQPATEMLQIYFTIDGLNIAFYLEYDVQNSNEHLAETKNIDLGFVDGKDFILQPFRNMLKDDFDIGTTILTHSKNFENMQTQIEASKDTLANVCFLRNSMEKFCYTFQNNTVLVDTLNLAPKASDALENITVNVNEAFEIDFSENIFTDFDNNELTIEVMQAYGNDFPEGVIYNENTMKLEGTVTEAQKIYVKAKATDTNNSYTEVQFKITVIEPTNIKNNKQGRFIMYPNPGNGLINFKFNTTTEGAGQLAVYNMHGQKIISENIESNKINNIDIQQHKNGIYFVYFKHNNITATQSYAKK